MKKTIGRGLFITFEGPEGCGKSTHAKLLKEYLESFGHEIVLTREPGGTVIGEAIREILMNPKESLAGLSEIMLFAADRIEHMEKVIIPGIRAGKIVISDRFLDSTTAYQIGGRGLPEDLVRYINSVSTKGFFPDLTILLDISEELGLKRAKMEGPKSDRFEEESLEFHKCVRRKYLEIAEEDPKRVKVINTEAKIEEVQEKIRKIIKDKVEI